MMRTILTVLVTLLVLGLMIFIGFDLMQMWTHMS